MSELSVIKRFKLGIIFKFSSGWMGGIIYIINIIKTLDYLDDMEKPHVTLFYSRNLKKYAEEISYPYLETVEWPFPSLIEGNIKSWLLRKNLFIDGIIKKFDLDTLFPLHDFPVKTDSNVKLIAWWADLQHKYYPDYFSRIQILTRNKRIKLILKNSDRLVVSSKTVLDDFNRFYRVQFDKDISIYHFISVIDNIPADKVDDLRSRYDLPEKYFLVSNQFHKHKNHEVVLRALAILKKRSKTIHVAFTGKFPAAPDSPYLAGLQRIIDENTLQSQVTMLGMISREEQLALMKHSQAVIQPSLFEGWSTVIEDAISLQVPVIPSDLKVNIEQLGSEHLYFDPHNPDELASILTDYPERNLNDSFYEDYFVRTRRTARELLSILAK